MEDSSGNGGESSQGNLLLKKQGKLIMYEKVQHVCEWDQLYLLSICLRQPGADVDSLLAIEKTKTCD